jgi:hypothetical protein
VARTIRPGPAATADAAGSGPPPWPATPAGMPLLIKGGDPFLSSACAALRGLSIAACASACHPPFPGVIKPSPICRRPVARHSAWACYA